MRHAPDLGSHVRYRGGLVTGPCTGIVLAHYPVYEYDGEQITHRVRPEIEWHVSMEVDELPTPWCYPEHRFAPCVADLQPMRAKAEKT